MQEQNVDSHICRERGKGCLKERREMVLWSHSVQETCIPTLFYFLFFFFPFSTCDIRSLWSKIKISFSFHLRNLDLRICLLIKFSIKILMYLSFNNFNKKINICEKYKIFRGGYNILWGGGQRRFFGGPWKR